MRGAQRVSDRRLRACLSDLVVHVIPVDRSSRRATVCVNYHARAQWSNSGLQVEDLKVSVTQSQSALVLDVSGSCTFLDLKMDDVMLFRFGLRSPMRNRELHRTTESFLDVDGTPRRQSRKTACLGQIDCFSETYTT